MTKVRAGELVVVDDERALASAVAERFIAAANAAIASRGRFDIALAGGSTPKAAYALLATPGLRERVAWGSVRFFFGDERCVPPGDKESNFRMAREALFDPLGIDAGRIFRMHGEDAPDSAAAAYATLLARELGPAVTFDLVMLGMGPDGHTASLFPGTSPLTDDDALVRAPWVEKFATFRVTLTPRVINAARSVEVATAGEAKADALAAALQGPFDPVQTPIQILAPRDGQLTWLVDRAAASKLH